MNWALKFVLQVLPQVFPLISGELRDLLEEHIKAAWKKAAETPNPMDDLAVRILAAIVDVELD